jgi:spore germination protein YaaH
LDKIRSKAVFFMRKMLISVLTAVCLVLPCAAAPYESLTYLYGGSSQTYDHNINRTRRNLSTVAADYFHIDGNGNAAITKIPDRAFIRRLQLSGIRVVAFVSNHWDREIARLAMAKRASVAAMLAHWVEVYGLDGLDVDIENLTHADKENFTDFIRLLSELMPQHKKLSVAAAANPQRWTTGWHGMYDYAALGRMCNAVMLMTYDQSYEGSAAGPVASYTFTRDSVREALRHIPRDKLIMGIPFYGRYWALLNSGGDIAGKAFTVSNIETITRHYTSKTWYDTLNHCARATVTVDAGDPGMDLLGGRKLDAGVYDIWYENDRSYETKMRLCREYGIAGVGSWALGQEPERIWLGYRSWLGNVPFTDLAGHWGEGAMTGLFELGILSGYGNGLCGPDNAVTRAEICVLLCNILGMAPADVSSAPAEVRGHWSAGYVWAAIRHGIMSGDGGTYPRYRPGDPVTRAELASLCAKALSVRAAVQPGQPFFPDVAPDMWFYGAVSDMRALGVISGMPDGRFHPESGATRAQASAILWSMMDLGLIESL